MCPLELYVPVTSNAPYSLLTELITEVLITIVLLWIAAIMNCSDVNRHN